MSSFSITEPSKRQKWTAGILVVGYALITIMPLVWILMTGFKSPADAISYPPMPSATRQKWCLSQHLKGM